MPKFKKIKNAKNIIYELAGDQDNFTNEDKKKLFKLLKKIENGENISGKFNKSNYNTQKLLTKKIIYKDEKKEGTLTLLCHSVFYKNNQAFEELLQEAINQGILKDVLSEELIQKLPNGLTITYTALVSCILEEDSKAIRAVLEASKKNGILKEILNQKVKVEKAEGQEISYTLLDYANKHNCKESAKILKGFEEILNIEVKNDIPVSDNAETRCEDINKDHEIHESRIVNSEEARNILIESENPQLMCESNKEAKNSLDEQGLNASDSPSSAEPCFDATNEKDKPLTQQRQAILASVVSAALLVSSIALYIMKMPVVAVVVGIVGLACIGLVLYKPNTKLEKIRDIKQSIIASPALNSV